MTPPDEPSMDHAFLEKVTEVVLQNLDNEQFGVENLSDEVGISRSHLHRKLKILKGQSVSQFVREIRLKEAMKLLQKAYEAHDSNMPYIGVDPIFDKIKEDERFQRLLMLTQLPSERLTTEHTDLSFRLKRSKQSIGY